MAKKGGDFDKILFAPGLEVAVPRNALRSNISLYMAGPLGFSEAGRGFHANTVKLVQSMGA